MMRKILVSGLALAPLAAILRWVVEPGDVVVFTVSALALVPLAWLIGEATEQAAEHTGSGVGGFLNASFGNAPELIIAVFAIADGLPDVVRGSITGSIVSNLLLVLGLALVSTDEEDLNWRSLVSNLGLVVWASLLLLVPSIPGWHGSPDRHTLAVVSIPIAVVLLLTYPLCKRFTWMAHFVLGAVDGLAPLGAYVGIAGKITLPAVLLFVAVTLWVAGFDIICALMDLRVDRQQGIRSLPVRFGEASGHSLPILLHLGMLVLLAGAGMLASAGAAYYLGVISVAGLILYEEYLFRSGANLFVINERVFISNMMFSVLFLLTTVGGYL